MKTEPTINIQNEVAKIHSQFGMTEIANYRIEKLFEMYVKQSSPKIKQLEWKYDEEFFMWEANSVFGKYFVKAGKNEGDLMVDANKASAQADFEKRVKECLE